MSLKQLTEISIVSSFKNKQTKKSIMIIHVVLKLKKQTYIYFYKVVKANFQNITYNVLGNKI